MLYYLTKDQSAFTRFVDKPVIVISNEEEAKILIVGLYISCKLHFNSCLGFDTENSGLDFHLSSMLLVSIGNPENQIVIDHTTMPLQDLLPDNYNDFIYIIHNAQYDFGILYHQIGIALKNLHCTMVYDQKIYKGFRFTFGLHDVIERHLKFRPAVSKDTRNLFVGRNPKTFIASFDEVNYSGSDVAHLNEVYNCQKVVGKKFKMDEWLTRYEMKLPQVLAKGSGRGFELDQEAIKNNANENHHKRHELEIKLDSILIEYQKKYAPNYSNPKLIQKRVYQGILVQTDLFGVNNTEHKVKFNKGNINYASPTELVKLASSLGMYLPYTFGKDYVGIAIPEMDGNKVSKESGDYATDNIITGISFTTNAQALETAIIDYPENPCIEFYKVLTEHRKVSKEYGTYGYSFIDNINPKTGKIHTIFRQASTENSRLSSGGGRSQPDKYNAQNIPRSNKLRNCFSYGESYDVVTTDLNGAEVTIMCDKANDMKLYEWAVKNDDAHSPIATEVWKNIFLYRAGLEDGLWHDFKEFKKNKALALIKFKRNLKSHSFLETMAIEVVSNTINNVRWWTLYQTFIVSKTINKPYRQAGKNGTFGAVYGMGDKKAASTYNGTTGELWKTDPNAKPVNVTKEEGKVALWAIENAIPATFAMVKANSKLAFQQGYLILNERSGSRIWFHDILKMLQTIRKKIDKNPDLVITNIWSGKYTLDEIIEMYDYKMYFLKQVHDELVYAIPKDYGTKVIMNYEEEQIHYSGDLRMLPEYVMTTVANRFLNNVQMKAETTVADYWTK